MSNTMSIHLAGGKRVDASFDGFEVATDQAVDSGGNGSAPEPFDLFLASLATCAGVYILGFCQRRAIPHDGVRLVQTWERDDTTGRITTIRIRIEVPAGFPEKYHAALVRAANQCAVKKTIENPPEFDVQTVVRQS